MRVKPGHQKFNTPIEVGTVTIDNTNDNESVDEQIDGYLGDRRKRLLDEAKLAELEHVTEDERTEAARSRKERELLLGGKVSPTGKEGDMEDTETKVEQAAETAAEAAAAGVPAEQATGLGTGKAKVVVINPKSGEQGAGEEKGGWVVTDGKPVRDPEGEYSFNQALKVAALEKAKGNNDPMAILKWMKEQGLLTGGKSDTFMSQFTAQLAEQSVQSIINKPNTSGGATEAIQQQINTLRTELREASDPVKAAGRVKEMYETFSSLGLIPKPSTGGTIDETKEEHRHEEEMEQIRAKKASDERLADIAADIPESVGRGIGQDIRHAHGGERKPSASTILDTIECKDCGTKFTVPPEAMEKGEAECPKCGMVYRAEG